MKALSVAPVAAGAVVFCGVLLSFSALAASPGAIPPGAPRTLDLTAVPMSITEPGTYVVRHNWDLTASHPSGSAPGYTAIGVLVDNVVIDFGGYQIKFADYGTGIKVKGNDVTLRNGSLHGGPFSSAIRSSGASTVVDNMSIHTYEGLQLLGPRAEVRDSDIEGEGGTVTVGEFAVVERNLIQAKLRAVRLANNARVEHNRLQAFGDIVVDVYGNGNLLNDNTLEPFGGDPGVGGPGFGLGIWLHGSSNVVLRNTVRLPRVGALILVDGSANTIEGNVAPLTLGQSDRGIWFRQGGNFYGNNRMAAQIPYDVGGMQQTDWGGNVGY